MRERYDGNCGLALRLKRCLGSYACRLGYKFARVDELQNEDEDTERRRMLQMAANSSDTMDGTCESVNLRRAECWADAVLERYWDGEYPVDPNAIAVSMGMDVYFARIPGRLAGLILKTADQSMPSIFVDEGASTPRKRFTIAHEIGHYVENIEDLETPLEGSFGVSDATMASDKLILAGRRPTRSGTPDQSLTELFADRFAHSLLMPKNEVMRFINAGIAARQAAAYFGVSRVTMKNRFNYLSSNLDD